MSTAVFPSQNSWITSRSTEAELNDQNCKIILPQKISELQRIYVDADSVYILVDVPQTAEDYRNKKSDYTQTVKLSSLYYSKGNYVKELDITTFVKEYVQWQTIPIIYVKTGKAPYGVYKNNTSYYKHNSNEIIVCNENYKTQGLVSFPVFPSMIQSACRQKLPSTLHHISSPVRFDNEVYINAIYVSTNKEYPTTPLKARFRIYYTPLGESVKLQVPKTNPQANQFCIPYSQQQPIVDNVTLGREMQSVANRAGCEKKEVVRTIRSIRDKRKLGTIYREKDDNGNFTGNIWRLTGERTSIYSDTYMVVEETWSKNWSYRSENVPINREFRSWNIPADIVQRNLLWQDYCLLTRKDVRMADNTLLEYNVKTELMRGLNGSYGGQNAECNNMWFYQKDADGNCKGAVLSCSAFGFGNSLVFSGKTKDNLSAGVQRVKSDDDDKDYQFCKDVYYCNDNGKVDNMCVQIGSDLYGNDSYSYPACKRTVKSTVAGVIRYDWENMYSPAGVNLFKTDTMFKVLKDPCEQLNFTYQLHLLTDDGQLLIGSAWAASNPLVKQWDGDQTIKVWKLTQYLPQGAQVMTATYGTQTQSNLFSVDVSSDDPSVTFNAEANDGAGVCVTDEHNNILIAFNGNERATFNAKFTHDYGAIAKALKNK